MRVWILAVLCLSYLWGTPQSNSEVNVNSGKSLVDSSFIEDKSNYLNIFIFGKTKYTHLNITNKETNQTLKYRPNSNFNVGFGFNYKWMGLGVAFNLPSLNNDDDKYGKTKSLDAQMNIFAHRFLLDVYLNYYKGYYIDNPELIDISFDKSGAYPTLPTMVSKNWGLSYFYVLNHKRFSYRASFVQNEVQKKMAGSMIFGFITHYNITASDTAFVPYNFIKDIEDADKYLIKGVTSLDIGPMFGYAYNFVIWKNVMITLSTVPGFVYQKIGILANIDGKDTYVTNNKVGMVISNKLAIVYNGKDYYYGINYNDFHSIHEYEKVSLGSNVGNFRFFFGRRFSVKKKK